MVRWTMRWLAGMRRRLAGAWVPVGAIGLIAYFAFHAVQGDHGLLARFRLEAEAGEARAILAGLTEQRAWLQRRADLLNHQHLDLDML